jgi:signal transduction histidine kinase
LIGQYPNIWSSDDPSQFPIEEGLQDAIQAGKGWKGDHLNKRKDGTEFYEQLTITPVYDHAKILTHFVGIKQDITERILSEERRQRVAQVESENRELQGAAATRNEFLSTVSHELRTPLTTVSAFADILFNSRSENLTDRQRQHIELIRKSSRHLTELIDDLLSVTQTDSGQMILKMTEFDLSALLAEIVDSSNVWLTDRNQKLLLDDETANRGITADRTRLIQILSNLITNASKYSDQGEDITLSAKLSGDICEFSVSDQGIGISDNDQKLMFDAFFRGGQSLNKPGVGSGLGLTVVRSLVDLHDGAITVESQPGEGTNVTVSIPRVSR